MKKGIFYIPLFMVVILNIGYCWYTNSWYTFTAWFISFLFICEIYYLRFIK